MSRGPTVRRTYGWTYPFHHAVTNPELRRAEIQHAVPMALAELLAMAVRCGDVDLASLRVSYPQDPPLSDSITFEVEVEERQEPL